MAEKTSFKDSLTRAVALIGLVLVLLLGAWGIILLAFNLSTFVSSVGSGVGSLFSVGSDAAPTEQVATTTAPAAEEKPAATTPAKTTASATSGSSAAKSTYVAAPRTYNLYGYADLAVHILSIHPAAVYGGNNVVQFEIQNVGTNVAKAGWNFTASLPVGYAYTYTASNQKALYPGDKIMYTLFFSQPYNYGNCYYDSYSYNHNRNNCGTYNTDGVVSITADPYGYIFDANRGNNTASAPVGYVDTPYPYYRY